MIRFFWNKIKKGEKVMAKDLRCSCKEPVMYKGESGIYWCEVCCGYVPQGRAAEINKYCKCEIVSGVHLSDDTGDIHVYCDSCRRAVHPDREFRSAVEIADESGAENGRRLIGPAAFKCVYCDHLEFSPHTEDMDRFISLLRECRSVICPRCRKANKLTNKWDVMLK
jgi:hypothetical protein